MLAMQLTSQVACVCGFALIATRFGRSGDGHLLFPNKSAALFYSSLSLTMNFPPITPAQPNAWSQQPNPLIEHIWQQLPAACRVLDLGCGPGRDTLFLARHGFLVTAIDRSPEALQQLQFQATRLALPNIHTICHDLDTATFPAPPYYLVHMANILHFLSKESAIALLTRVKASLCPGGRVTIQAFTTADVLYPARRHKAFFTAEELKSQFKNFEIELCEEEVLVDRPHPGTEYPHEHHLVNFVGRKP